MILASCLGPQCAGEQALPSIRHIPLDFATHLEAVEWGGRGVPVVLLAGLGHPAHVFDEFATQLTDAYHVFGITRRGFGASSQPETGYDIPGLATDIRIVLDSLGIGRAVLAGHSPYITHAWETIATTKAFLADVL